MNNNKSEMIADYLNSFPNLCFLQNEANQSQAIVETNVSSVHNWWELSYIVFHPLSFPFGKCGIKVCLLVPDSLLHHFIKLMITQPSRKMIWITYLKSWMTFQRLNSTLQQQILGCPQSWGTQRSIFLMLQYSWQCWYMEIWNCCTQWHVRSHIQ